MSLKVGLLIKEAYNTEFAKRLWEDGLRPLWVIEDSLSEYSKQINATASFKTTPLYLELHQPEAYVQIVALVGVEPDEALVISYDPSLLEVAYSVGLGTHLCGQALAERRLPAPLRPSMIAPQWLGNIAAIRTLLAQTKPGQWAIRPRTATAEDWSGLQILSHLIESEIQHQRRRLQRILQEDCPFIEAPVPPGPKQKVMSLSASELVARFELERQKTIVLVKSLSADEWRRPARHSIFGLTTLLEMAHFTAQHDRLHIQQLCQALGRCED